MVANTAQSVLTNSIKVDENAFKRKTSRIAQRWDEWNAAEAKAAEKTKRISE
jgi:hypothetical protein